jgi:Fe-S-cluster containining protein
MDAIYREERSEITQSLKSSKSPDNVNSVVIKFYERLSGRLSDIITENNLPIACHKGCNYCCNLRVEVRAHEVFTIARFIQKTFTQDETRLLVDRLQETVEAITGLTREEHFAKNIECALLLEGACSVYDVRPSMCRKHHSIDVEQCKRSFETPHDLAIPPVGHQLLIQATRTAVLGFRDGMEKAGFDSTLYELNSAALAALKNPECGKKWRKGKKAFPKYAEALPACMT